MGNTRKIADIGHVSLDSSGFLYFYVESFPFMLTSTGNGTGVSTLQVTVSATTTFTLDGVARFYSDAAGTLDESTTWAPTAGGTRTIYLKCTSGSSNMWISANTVTKINSWSSSTNAASLSGDISKLTVLTYVNVSGNNTLSSSVSGLTSLTYLRISGSNTLSGSVAALTGLTYIYVTGSNTLSGSITALTSLTFLSVGGNNTLSGSVTALTGLTIMSVVGSNTLSGSVAALTSLTVLQVTGSNTLSGSVAALTGLTYVEIYGSNTVSGSVAALTSLSTLAVTGSNTLSGSITALTSLTVLLVQGNNTISGDLNPIVSDLTTCTLNPCAMVDYTSGATWHNATITINPADGYGYSSAEIDSMLIDMAASNTMSGRTITLQGSSAARTAASDAAVTKLTTTDSGYTHVGCTVITN